LHVASEQVRELLLAIAVYLMVSCRFLEPRAREKRESEPCKPAEVSHFEHPLLLDLLRQLTVFVLPELSFESLICIRANKGAKSADCRFRPPRGSGLTFSGQVVDDGPILALRHSFNPSSALSCPPSCGLTLFVCIVLELQLVAAARASVPIDVESTSLPRPLTDTGRVDADISIFRVRSYTNTERSDSPDANGSLVREIPRRNGGRGYGTGCDGGERVDGGASGIYRPFPRVERVDG
jgi:hypothetical protein